MSCRTCIQYDVAHMLVKSKAIEVWCGVEVVNTKAFMVGKTC